MKPEIYKNFVKRLKDDILANAGDGLELDDAINRMIRFFENEIACARAKSNRLLRFNRQMRKKLEELTDAKS